MLSIRENVFETNSSSMHAITVACPLDDKKLYKDYLVKELKRWKNKKGGYDVDIICDEEKLDGVAYDVRRYEPHFSINDKLMYAYATIIQHFGKDIVPAPYKPWPFKDLSKDEKKEYDKKWEEWRDTHSKANNEVVKKFKDQIEEFEKSFQSYLHTKLHIDEEKININFNYVATPEGEIKWFPEKSYFSTGCYGNEEFYLALTDCYYSFAEWVCNPYSAVLAGSDEQSKLEWLKQDAEILRCTEEAYKHMEHEDVEDIIEELEDDKKRLGDTKREKEYVEEIDEMITRLKSGENFFPNTSKVIYPLGG